MFELNVKTLLIVCPLVFLAGLVDAIAGGGGLISLPAYLIAGLPPVVASATNKVSACMGATVTFFNYLKRGFINIKLALPSYFVAILFSSLGAKVQTLIPSDALKIFMLIALPCTLIIILNKKSLEPSEDTIFEYGIKQCIQVILIAIVMGFYDGIYGPGCGTFLLLAFVNIVKMDIKQANGLAKAINWGTNIGSLLMFIHEGKAFIALGLIAGVCNMCGCQIGSVLFAKKGVAITRPIMITVMILFIIKILLELLHVI